MNVAADVITCPAVQKHYLICLRNPTVLPQGPLPGSDLTVRLQKRPPKNIILNMWFLIRAKTPNPAPRT